MKQPPPLRGIRVLDFSRIIAGPNCTMQLGDLGAEIIKVERIGHGDETRHMRPPDSNGEAHFFLAYNRNKKSIAVDMKSKEGLGLVRRLAETCDVVIENFRPGVVKRLGIDYEAIRVANPGVVYCSISAYGQTGPMAKRPGLDPVLQAEMGLMALTGEPDGEAMRHPVSLTDIIASLLASTAISSALYRRHETGLGEYIDLSLMASAVAMMGNITQYYLTSGEDPPRTGNSHPTAVPVGAFFGSDGQQFYLACSPQAHFHKLAQDVLERPDLIKDPRFATTTARIDNRSALLTILSEVFATQPQTHWVQKIQASGLPAGPVRPVSEAMESPEVAAAGLLQTLRHRTAGEVRLTRSPIKLGETEDIQDTPPPTLGEHTNDVLHDILALPKDEIERLRTCGVIA